MMASMQKRTCNHCSIRVANDACSFLHDIDRSTHHLKDLQAMVRTNDPQGGPYISKYIYHLTDLVHPLIQDPLVLGWNMLESDEQFS